VTSGDVLIAADTSQIWRSTTGLSASWAARSFGGGHWDNDPGVVWAFCEQSDGDIFAATANGIFKSADAGLNWTRVSAARNAGTQFSIACDSNDTLWLADNGAGFYSSVNDGAAWNLEVTDTNAQCIYVLENDYVLGGSVGLAANDIKFHIYDTTAWTEHHNLSDGGAATCKSFFQPFEGTSVWLITDIYIYRAELDTLTTDGFLWFDFNFQGGTPCGTMITQVGETDEYWWSWSTGYYSTDPRLLSWGRSDVTADTAYVMRYY
jgi:hypothetical protein